jgi:hypothetical protein
MPRTITDIVPPSRRRQMAEQATNVPLNDITPPIPPTTQVAPPPPPPPSYEPPMRSSEFERRPKKGFPYGMALAALVVVAVCIGALYAFAGARVEITPTVNTVPVSGDFSATASVGDLPFEVISVDQVASQSVPAEGTETANEPAQGTITIYNDQAKVQELIKNTRFETPDGLIFRIRDSVKVPAGSETTPGSLSVTVYADEGGERYNIGPTTFTLPGLAGGDLFDKVYARSTEPMVGGFVGERPSVSESSRTSKYEGMKAGLQSDLMAAIAEKVPAEYVLVPGATTVTYTAQPDAAGTSGTVTLMQKGSAVAVIFPKEALGRAIAYKTIGAYTGQPVAVQDASGLTLVPAEGEAIAAGLQTLTFSLSGETSIVWIVEAAKVSGAVAGKTRDSAEAILAGFPEVERAVLVIRPFWEGKLPQDPEDIEIKVAEGAKGE